MTRGSLVDQSVVRPRLTTPVISDSTQLHMSEVEMLFNSCPYFNVESAMSDPYKKDNRWKL